MYIIQIQFVQSIATQVKYIEAISPLGLLFIETGDDVLRIDDGDDAVQLVHLLNVLIDEKCLNYRRWIGKASRLDEDPIEAFHALVELLERLHEVSADGAADAAVHDLDDLLVDVFGENFLVNADVAKFILDDSEFHPMSLIVEDMVQECGLARAPVVFVFALVLEMGEWVDRIAARLERAWFVQL